MHAIEDSDPGHPHHHVAEGTCVRAERRTRAVLAITVAMMVIELVVGKLTGSLALTADGWHMATHVGALGLSAVAYWFARTRAGHRAFTFGTGKVNALAGYTSAIVLALVALVVAGESLARLLRPGAIDFADALPVAVVGLVVNLASAKLLDLGDEHDAHHHDHNRRAAYMHVLADAFTSVLAIAALVLGRYLGWTVLDPLMGLVGAAVILGWAAGLCRGAAAQLVDVCLWPEDKDHVRAALEGIDDVRVLDLHLWPVGAGRRGCTASIISASPREVSHYRAAVRERAKLAHLTIEVHRCAGSHEGPSCH
jgi:cation diffusion facilitator family transporter